MNDTYKVTPPYGFLIILAITAILFVIVINVGATTRSGGGDAAFGEGIEALFAVSALWIGLTLLLLIGGIMGEMPGRAKLAAVLLTPVSGIAAFVAIDMCSRHMRWAVVLIALLALLIAFYASWVRMEWLRAKMPATTRVSVVVWGGVFALSMTTFLAAL